MDFKLRNCYHSWINVDNIYGSMKPFYYVAKFHGFVPFHLNDRQELFEDRVTNAADCIIIMFTFCGYLYIIHTMINFEMGMEILDDHIFVTTSRGILCTITNFVSVVCMISNIVNRKGLLKVLHEFHRIDNQVKFR